MADVLLTHSNHLYFDRKQVAKMQPYPPLQTLLAAAVLRERGISVALFDPTLNAPEDGFAEVLEVHRPRLVVVCEDDFNFLSKMCLGLNRELAFWMAATARAKAVPIAAHGSDASDHVAEYLGAGFDAVLIGEVETTLVELAEGWPRASIRGLAYRESSSVWRNPPRELRADLASLPPAAWDLVDMDQYRRAWKQAHGYFSLNMVSSRGCPYRCNWCAKPIYGNRYHARPPHAVASEMRDLKTRFQPDHIWFADDIFALSPKWTRDFRGRGGSARRANPVQDAVALRSDDARYGEDLQPRGMRRSLDGRGVRLPTNSGRHGQGHARQGQYIARVRICDAMVFARACFFSSAIPGETWERNRRHHPHGPRDAAGRHRHLRLLSRFRAPASIEHGERASSARNRTGPTARISP